MKDQSRLSSAGLVVAIIALIAALSGAAIALPGKNSVDSGDLKRGAVTKKAIKKGAVVSKAIKDGAVNGAKLADGSVTDAKVADESLGAGKISDLLVLPLTKADATFGANAASARAAAPEIPLFSKAGLTVYGKCFADLSAGPDVTAEIIVRTDANGAMLEGTDILPDGPELLDTGTLEADRVVADSNEVDLAEASFNDQEFLITSATGTTLSGVLGTIAKRGNLPGGNGQLNAGNSCAFNGHVIG